MNYTNDIYLDFNVNNLPKNISDLSIYIYWDRILFSKFLLEYLLAMKCMLAVNNDDYMIVLHKNIPTYLVLNMSFEVRYTKNNKNYEKTIKSVHENGKIILELPDFQLDNIIKIQSIIRKFLTSRRELKPGGYFYQLANKSFNRLIQK